MSSALGALDHVARTRPAFRICSARRRLACGTISTETPLRPARPVRPLRCSKVSGLVGRSACTTKSSAGRSRPRAATSVQTPTRARPERRASSAEVRSCWLSSPDSITALNPRRTNAKCSRRVASRVAQNTSAPGASYQRKILINAPSPSGAAISMARYSISSCGTVRSIVSIRSAFR